MKGSAKKTGACKVSSAKFPKNPTLRGSVSVSPSGSGHLSCAAQRAVRGMLREGHGRIVLISSTAALHGAAGQTNYAAAKAGLVGFARSPNP
ncbi:hypothetical protein GCM10017771_18080 [Streptomyces capitiformicae]|uniref:Uncharacterized protein n=1 Tax=Streptomyces capitiformicae TaxID=2014920 RepID=A0A919L5A9_9ACTN|nr:hypothetical protein GCM10017771_18080 [Streptomyces capitiformicae]